MENRLFFSFCFENEKRTSPYQLQIQETDILTTKEFSSDSIQLDESRFIDRRLYEHYFFVNLFWADILEISNFLDYHRDEYEGDFRDFIKKIRLLFSSDNQILLKLKYDEIKLVELSEKDIDDNDLKSRALSNKYLNYSFIQDHINEVLNWLEELSIVRSGIKLKWLGGPSQFGYVFNELAKKGFIEVPQSKGQDSYSKYAQYCMELFDINTTLGTLKNEISPKRNHLDDANKDAFKIPYKSELS